jgi:CHAD domain-containing protein
MAFEFKKKESVRKTVKRIGRKGIEKALCSLGHCDRLEAVHEVRKDIKQLRALLRLVRRGMPRSECRRYSDTLREAAGHLAAARDAHVKLNALRNLIDHFQRELAPRSFQRIKAILSADCHKQHGELSRKRAPRRVARLLKKLSGWFSSLKLKDSGWSALEPGIKRSYRDGRCGYQVTRETGIPENFHEWRKRVKDLYYQVGLLCPIWPEQMSAAEAELKHLGECLGDDHDLFLLTKPDTLKLFRKRDEKETEALKALADQRQRELRNEALALGARFYKEKPSVFCKRLRQYWKRWRHESKRGARAA